VGLLDNIKELMSITKPSNGSHQHDEELRNLDALIEDIFRMDEKSGNGKKKVSEEEN